MTQTQTTKITYRKTKSGEWVAYGPASAMHTGYIAITKRDGTTKGEQISRLGRPFFVAGAEMVYGYIGSKHSGRACITGGNCSSFGAGRSCGGHDCDGF